MIIIFDQNVFKNQDDKTNKILEVIQLYFDNFEVPKNVIKQKS